MQCHILSSAVLLLLFCVCFIFFSVLRLVVVVVFVRKRQKTRQDETKIWYRHTHRAGEAEYTPILFGRELMRNAHQFKITRKSNRVQQATVNGNKTTNNNDNNKCILCNNFPDFAASSFCVFFLFLFMCLRLICCASVMPVQRRKKWMRLNRNHLQPTQVYTCMQMRQSCGATCIRYNVCVRLLFDKLNFEHSQHRAASTE